MPLFSQTGGRSSCAQPCAFSASHPAHPSHPPTTCDEGVVSTAASVIANIAASPGESSAKVIESGAVPLLIALLASALAQVRENSVARAALHVKSFFQKLQK